MKKDDKINCDIEMRKLAEALDILSRYDNEEEHKKIEFLALELNDLHISRYPNDFSVPFKAICLSVSVCIEELLETNSKREK